MSDYLGYDLGFEIVTFALGRTARAADVSLDLALGEILPSPSERELFRNAVQFEIQARGFEMAPDRMSFDRQHTIRQITNLVAALPGKSGTKPGG